MLALLGIARTTRAVTNNPAPTSRAQLVKELFPDGVPVLWCPLLTHYDDEGRVDSSRIARHVEHLAGHVRGFLIPGSTSDGWELSEAEEQAVLEIALEQVGRFEVRLLVGILRPDLEMGRARLRAILKGMTARQSGKEIENAGERGRGRKSTEAALGNTGVCGFVVCPPRGREVSQAEMGRQLAAFLEEGVPTAIYQLPQVTQNEIGADLAGDLAKTFSNFVLFKDSSGADRVAVSGGDLEGVFMVRGAEGDYARWLKSGGGAYNGFLLSTANCFARELTQMIEDLSAGRMEVGNRMSARLSTVVGEVFQLVSGLPQGNPFTNANKAMDHVFAYGPRAGTAPAPRLHAGVRLPVETIRGTGEILLRNGFMPEKGYLE